MPLLKPCAGKKEDGKLCGKLTSGRNSRCEECAPEYERLRDEREPWRYLYDDPRWRATTRRVRERDGHQCTYRVGSRKCISEGPLSVHHETKLRHTWARLGKPRPGSNGWSHFVEVACDMRHLRSLCERHHKLVDNNNPAERWVGVPGVESTSQHRTNTRGRRRRREKHLREARGKRKDAGGE